MIKKCSSVHIYDLVVVLRRILYNRGIMFYNTVDSAYCHGKAVFAACMARWHLIRVTLEKG